MSHATLLTMCVRWTRALEVRQLPGDHLGGAGTYYLYNLLSMAYIGRSRCEKKTKRSKKSMMLCAICSRSRQGVHAWLLTSGCHELARPEEGAVVGNFFFGKNNTI